MTDASDPERRKEWPGIEAQPQEASAYRGSSRRRATSTILSPAIVGAALRSASLLQWYVERLESCHPADLCNPPKSEGSPACEREAPLEIHKVAI